MFIVSFIVLTKKMLLKSSSVNSYLNPPVNVFAPGWGKGAIPGKFGIFGNGNNKCPFPETV